MYNLRRRWSISSVFAMQQCGHFWKLKYEDPDSRDNLEPEARPELAFGSSIHSTIERIHKENLFEISKWIHIWNTEWKKESELVNWAEWPGRKRNYEKTGLDILSDYTENEENLSAQVLDSEYKFEIELIDTTQNGTTYLAKGIIDQIRQLPNGDLLVIDFKTSKYEPDPLVLRFDPQLTLYAEAAFQKYHQWPRVAQVHLRSNTTLESLRKPHDINTVIRMIREAEHRVKENLLTRQLGYQCNTCTLRTQCLEGLLNQSN